jgi:hypothetical protein
MAARVYHGDFNSWDDVVREFRISSKPPFAPIEPEVIFASYEIDGYEGAAVVVFKMKAEDKKVYYVTGGHCSCHGLEDQWDLTEYDSALQFMAALEKGIGGYTRDADAKALMEFVKAL